MEEESRKIKPWWDLRGVGQWGWGYVCWWKKKKEEGKETYGRKESKKNKKSQLNGSIIIFSQYFIINFKYRLLLVNIGE